LSSAAANAYDRETKVKQTAEDTDEFIVLPLFRHWRHRFGSSFLSRHVAIRHKVPNHKINVSVSR
jgi:hypothetical protein